MVAERRCAIIELGLVKTHKTVFVYSYILHLIVSVNVPLGLMRIFRSAFLLATFTLLVLSCAPRDNRVITGTTMGTYFRVETVCHQSLDESEIAQELERLTLIFSTYRDDSEISRVNSDRSENWISVSPDFLAVTSHARRIFVASQGAFDPTVGPVVERWGFGAADPEGLPSDDEVAALRMQTGLNHIEIREMPPAIRKNLVDTRIDYSAIAKGFAVDRLAELTLKLECENFLVDIGGEVRVNGTNRSGELWRIGIENPKDPNQVLGYLERDSGAVATSGTYRNIKTIDGEQLSHLMDPVSGRPVDHEILLASVYAEEATTADAWATALAVKGLEPSMDLISRWRLSAMLVETSSTGELIIHRFGDFETAFEAL